MANSPREGQQFVGFKLDEKLLVMVDKARGFVDRSLFFRQAIAEKLKQMGITVSDDLVFPPDRVHRLNCTLNDAPSSEPNPERREVKYSKPATKRAKRKPKGS